jgi:hypothetical protein
MSLRIVPLASSYLHGNRLFGANATIAPIFGLNSTLMVENTANLSQLTSYKDFFISYPDDQFAQHNARACRPYAVANRVFDPPA